MLLLFVVDFCAIASTICRATFDLSMVDIMELARNSILQSGFEVDFKKKWLGQDYQRGLTFCDEKITHVPVSSALNYWTCLLFEPTCFCSCCC